MKRNKNKKYLKKKEEEEGETNILFCLLFSNLELFKLC